MNKEDLFKVLNKAGANLFNAEFFLELNTENRLERSLLFYLKGYPYELIWWSNLMYLKFGKSFKLIFDDIKFISTWPDKTFKNHLEFKLQGATVALIGV